MTFNPQAPSPAPAVNPFLMDLRQAIETVPPPLDFVLPGTLAGTVSSLVSPGGAGKSMLALQLAVLVATGRDTLEIGPVPTGRVLYLALEDPPLALRHRVHALGSRLDAAVRDLLFEELEIHCLVGQQVDVMADDGPWFQYIESRATGCRLIVVDTLRRVHSLDENDGGEMARLVGLLEALAVRTGAAVLFLHHSSKAAAMAGQGDAQQASRGSSVLVDNIRSQQYLSTMTRDEAKVLEVDEAMRKLWVRHGWSKQNYGSPVADRWYRRTAGGVLEPGHLGAAAASQVVIPAARKERWK